MKNKTIPDKMYFRIGETAEILKVKPYVLRYWETEFPDIKPVKSQSNQRLYKRKDVETLLVIKHLLYDEKFTINGARQHLKDTVRSQAKADELPGAEETAPDPISPKESSEIFSKLRSELGWCLEELRR